MQQSSPATADKEPFGKWYAVLIFLCFAAAYFLSYSLRSVNATLAPYLTEDLSLTAADLGWLSSAYFISFAALQYPLGFWLDRYGARRVEAGLLVIAAAGALLMAIGTSLSVVSAGRILVGLGVASCLMAPFSYLRRCYPPERQAQMGLWLLVAGISGAVASTLPAGMLAAAVGWRMVFTLFAVLLLVVAIALYFIVPDRDLEIIRRTADRSDKAQQSAPQAVRILSHPAITRLIPLAVVTQGGLVALQTLWIGPWMVQVLGMNNAQMAGRLFAFTLVLMCSYLGMSFLTPVLQRKGVALTRIAVVGYAIVVPIVLLIALLPWHSAWLLWLVFALAYPAQSLLQPALTLHFPRAVAGRVLTVYNLFMFSGAFLMQWGIGVVIDLIQRFGTTQQAAYQATLGSLAVCQALCLLWFIYKTPGLSDEHPGTR